MRISAALDHMIPSCVFGGNRHAVSTATVAELLTHVAAARFRSPKAQIGDVCGGVVSADAFAFPFRAVSLDDRKSTYNNESPELLASNIGWNSSKLFFGHRRIVSRLHRKTKEKKNTMNRLLKIVTLVLLALSVPLVAQAQQSLSSTTLSVAIVQPPGAAGQPGVAASGTVPTTFVQVASTTGIIPKQSMIYVDFELMDVLANPSAGVLYVQRGAEGTRATAHQVGATVYFSTGQGLGPFLIPTNLSQTSYGFIKFDPVGACTATQQLILPQINVNNGLRWNCINGLWMVDNGYIWIAANGCGTSGNLTAAGPTNVGASFTGVCQVSTTGTGTNTHYYSFSLNNILAAISSPARQVAVLDATFMYGVQTTGLGTQACTPASGTWNSIIVFSSIAYPTAAASETASTVTPVRADSGTQTQTPVCASANVGTTTAGAFYSEKFIPASAFFIDTNGTQYTFNVALLNTATSATITNSPGALIHYAYIPDALYPQAGVW